MSAQESLSVGIVIERRKVLREEADWTHFLAGAMDITLFRGETEGYRSNLSNDPPRVYVVLSPGEEVDDPDVVPFMVTVCPYEAERYTESGEDIVEGVVMPIEIAAWVQGFIDKHHVDEPFRKRKQKKAYDPRKGGLRARPKIDPMRRGGGFDGE